MTNPGRTAIVDTGAHLDTVPSLCNAIHLLASAGYHVDVFTRSSSEYVKPVFNRPSIAVFALKYLRERWMPIRGIKPKYHGPTPLHPPFADEDGIRWFRQMDPHMEDTTPVLSLSDRRLVEASGYSLRGACTICSYRTVLLDCWMCSRVSNTNPFSNTKTKRLASAGWRAGRAVKRFLGRRA